MRQNRQSKIIAIVALCLAVVGITLGFAAFSNTLTISSSATVSPNASDFNINIYGVGDIDDAVENYYNNAQYFKTEAYTSLDVSAPYVAGNGGFNAVKSATPAKITDDGENITISDINVEYSKPNQSALYYFMIKNEGEYDAYLNINEGLDDTNYMITKECTPGENTDADLVAYTCEWILPAVNFTASSGEIFEANDKLAKGDYIYMTMFFDYHDTTYLADGPFTVAFEDIVLNFTSTPPSA